MIWKSTQSLIAAATVLLGANSMSCEPAAREPVHPVSMVSILANAERYSGQQIAIFGYLNADWKLYLTRDHAAAFDLESSLHVSDTDSGDIASSGCMEKYVEIEAKLSVRERAPYTLVDVRRVRVPGMEPGKRGYDCYKAE
jgi:hypothetical protein